MQLDAGGVSAERVALRIALGLASATTPEGKAWLASNLEKEGVKATDSGLQYKIIKSGEDGAPITSAPRLDLDSQARDHCCLFVMVT